jgi:iron complex transport system ATP-binding protein
MLRAENISFSVGKKELISGVSVGFAPGKLHLRIGPNGAGKSTLIKVLARLLRPQTGEVFYEDTNVRTVSEAALAKRRAVLSQAVEIAFPLTVREVVMMGRYPHFGTRPGAADEKITDEVMEFFDVSEFSSRGYQTLSGGERQRVNFARVLGQLWDAETDASAASPFSCRYLFLDEPLTFLDIGHQIEFMKKVREFAAASDAVTVGVVHDLNLAARFSDDIVLMNKGRIISAGPTTTVLTPDRIREIFGVEAEFVETSPSSLHLIFS